MIQIKSCELVVAYTVMQKLVLLQVGQMMIVIVWSRKKKFCIARVQLGRFV